jgi:hypothetical protein
VSALKRWGWVALFAFLVVVLFVITFGRKNKLQDVKTEIDAARAEADAEKMQASLDLTSAAVLVEKQYQAQLKALSDRELIQAAELRKDPKKLAAFLVRAGAKKR